MSAATDPAVLVDDLLVRFDRFTAAGGQLTTAMSP